MLHSKCCAYIKKRLIERCAKYPHASRTGCPPDGLLWGKWHTQTRHYNRVFLPPARRVALVALPARLQRGLWTPMRLTSGCRPQRSGARSRARRLKIDLFSTAPRGGVRGAVRRGSACVARLRVLPAGRVRLLDRYGPESVDVTARSCRLGTWTADDKGFPGRVHRTERAFLLYYRRWTSNWGTGTTGLGTRGSAALRAGVSGRSAGRRHVGVKPKPCGLF